jgi:phosphate transport system protein
VLDLISEPEVQLPVDIPRMADSVSTMVQRALEAFLDGKAEVAEAVLQMDGIVDRMKDEAYIVLVQKMQNEPAVTRPALNVLLISRNLERIADHATNIAEDVIFWVRGADVRHGGAHYRQ